MHQQLIAYHRTDMFLVDFVINVRKEIIFEVAVFHFLSLEYVISI